MDSEKLNYIHYYDPIVSRINNFLGTSLEISETKNSKVDFSIFHKLYKIFTHKYDVNPYKSDGKFVDYNFPPSKETIFENYPNSAGDLHWVRAEDFSKNGKLYSKIHPEDVKQGFFGNCWFVAAVCCLAEKPNLIKRIFPTDQINKNGKYTLKLHKNGQPVSVEIDSLVPINQSDGSFFGTSSKNKQIWVPLLEKAYSKLHGSYRSLISGECHEAFYDLTGYPADLLSVVPLQFSWLKKKFRNGGFLLTAGINSKKPGHGQYKMKRKGLLVDHAYSIIDVKDHKEKGQNPVRLVKLRNPWSRFEWKGDYSDKSKKWDKKLKKDLHLCVDENDGVFWIDFEDFQEIFDTFSYCDTRKDWKEKSSSFQFNLKNGAIEAPRFKIEVPSTVEMTYVSLHQKDERMKNSPKNYIDLSAFVMKNSNSYFGEPKCVSLVESNIERNTLSKVKLPSGTYTIVPYTSGSHFSGPRDISRSATLLIHFSADKNVSKKSKEKNTLIKPVNKISTKKLGDKNNLKLKSFKSSTGNDLKPVNKIKIDVRKSETTALSSAKDMTDNSSNKSSFDDIKITVLRPNKEVVEDAQLSSLKTLGNVTEDSDGMFAMRTVKNGGQVLLGLDNKAKDKNEIEYEINTSECDNLMPALDSWQKNSIASFKMTKDQVEKTALIGSYIRKNNEKCRFSAKVAYSLYDDDNKIIK